MNKLKSCHVFLINGVNLTFWLFVLFNYTRNRIHYENDIISWLFRDLKRSCAETPSKELQSLHYCEFIIKIKAAVWYNVIGQNVLSHTSLKARLQSVILSVFKCQISFKYFLPSKNPSPPTYSCQNVWSISPLKLYTIHFIHYIRPADY